MLYRIITQHVESITYGNTAICTQVRKVPITMTTLHWGCVADDFTGATDLAGNLATAGWRTAVLTGVSAEDHALTGIDAAVIALKTRTAPRAEAIGESLHALRWLQRAGAQRYYFKYCSTFDSTSEGNIGPVLDALIDDLSAPRAVVVPSFPDTGRTVYQGHLFVGDQLLSASPMRHHPLTPMTESDVRALLAAQSRLPVSWVSHEAVRGGVEVLSSALAGITTSPRAIVVDAISNDDLGVIARAVRDDVLVSGGSGLALGLPGPGTATSPPPGVTSGRRLIVCGSASQRSREQIRHALDTGMPAWKVDIRQDDEAGRLRRWLGQRRADDPDAPVLVYATDSLDDLGDDDAHAARAAAIERLLANVVVSEVAAGTRSVIVAGGETSGSVVQALGIRQLRIVTQIAPGVSWAVAETASGEPVALALKSGNFGGTDFFTSAWEALS